MVFTLESLIQNFMISYFSLGLGSRQVHIISIVSLGFGSGQVHITIVNHDKQCIMHVTSIFLYRLT